MPNNLAAYFRRYLFDRFSWETGPFEKAGRTPEIATSKTKADSKCGLPPHPLCPPSSLHNYCFCRWPQASERSLFSLKKECTGYNDCLSFTYRFSTSFGLLVAIWLGHFVSFLSPNHHIESCLVSSKTRFLKKAFFVQCILSWTGPVPVWEIIPLYEFVFSFSSVGVHICFCYVCFRLGAGTL